MRAECDTNDDRVGILVAHLSFLSRSAHFSFVYASLIDGKTIVRMMNQGTKSTGAEIRIQNQNSEKAARYFSTPHRPFALRDSNKFDAPELANIYISTAEHVHDFSINRSSDPRAHRQRPCKTPPSARAPAMYFPLATVVAAFSLLAPSQALYLYIDGTSPKCFYEDLPKDTLVVGTYIFLKPSHEFCEFALGRKH